MSQTNSQVVEAFRLGRAARNGRGSLISGMLSDDGQGLFSYSTLVAFRRYRDGQVFHNGHSYSSTTSAHQPQWRGAVSFRCLELLVGPGWREKAEVIDAAPCAPDYITPPQWRHGWALLRFADYDVLCGGDSGQTDQLFAAILPERAETIEAALESLRPIGIHPDSKRQGNLFFEPVGDLPEGAEKPWRDCSIPVGAEGSRHVATLVATAPGPSFYVQGYITHPQHKRIHLKGWHKVHHSRAVNSASAPYRMPMGRGMAGYD